MSAFEVVRAMMRRRDSVATESQLHSVLKMSQLTIPNDLPRIVQSLHEPSYSSRCSKDVALHQSRPVGEQDAEELEREEAEVEVGRGEEGEEGVQAGRCGEEDVRVSQARVVADGLFRRAQVSCVGSRHVQGKTHPTVHLLNLAEQAQSLDYSLCCLHIFGGVLFQHVEEDGKSSRTDFLWDAWIWSAMDSRRRAAAFPPPEEYVAVPVPPHA